MIGLKLSCNGFYLSQDGIPSPAQMDAIREAVRQVVGDDKIAKFKDEDLALLWRQRFESKEDFEAATAEQLANAKLPAAPHRPP